jgi:3-oxoacyl-(acyl-carrier-protein) synthase
VRSGLRSQRGPQAEVTYAMTNSFGFGGTNAALILKKYKA